MGNSFRYDFVSFISKHFEDDQNAFFICVFEIFFVTLQPNLKFVYTMKRMLGLILLIFVSVSSMEMQAANAKTKPFTKRYRNERLIVVLQDLCNRNGYTLNIVDEIDRNKRITEDFKKAKPGTVLKKVLDKDFQGKVKKGVLTITRKPSPPVTYKSVAAEPYEIIDNDSVTLKRYMDTLFTVNCGMQTIEEPVAVVPAPEKKVKEDTTGVNRLEHNIQVLLGAGYSTMGYSLGADGKQTGSYGLNAQLRYLYYFTPNWGIGVGVGFSDYGSTGVLNTTTVFTPNVSDSDMPMPGMKGEDYEHHVKTHDWKESQRAYMVDVPVMVQCTYPIPNVQLENGPLKIYADLGANIGLPVSARRQLQGGSIEHVGWYKPWKLELTDIAGHDFYSEEAADFETTAQKLTVKMPAIGLMADVGVAIPLLKNLDLLVGVYANYVVNDVCANKQDIGWKNVNATGYKTHDFMNEYAGIIGTQYASSIHPWQAGVRVGINFNTRTVQRKEAPVVLVNYKRIEVCDTTAELQPREQKIAKEVVVQQIKRVLEKSVIWFDLNSAEPKLEPADILVQVADILKENPFQKILVTGHASREGDKAKNQILSEARAQAVVDMLLELGVQPEQIESRAEGIDRDYIQGIHDISLDRRVEITPVE